MISIEKHSIFLIFLCFLRILQTIDNYSCLKCSISTKLSQIVYHTICNTHILIYCNARYAYKLWKVLWCIFFSLILIFDTSYFYQTFINFVVRIWRMFIYKEVHSKHALLYKSIEKSWHFFPEKWFFTSWVLWHWESENPRIRIKRFI